MVWRCPTANRRLCRLYGGDGASKGRCSLLIRVVQYGRSDAVPQLGKDHAPPSQSPAGTSLAHATLRTRSCCLPVPSHCVLCVYPCLGCHGGIASSFGHHHHEPHPKVSRKSFASWARPSLILQAGSITADIGRTSGPQEHNGSRPTHHKAGCFRCSSGEPGRIFEWKRCRCLPSTRHLAPPPQARPPVSAGAPAPSGAMHLPPQTHPRAENFSRLACRCCRDGCGACVGGQRRRCGCGGR